MNSNSNFMNKRLAVVGFGAEGRSAAYFLAKAGARVEVFDSKPETSFPSAMVGDLKQLGVVFYFEAMGPFIGFDSIVRSPGISPRLPELAAAAKQGIPFTSATKIFFDLCPCPIVGVTGTKGKGTTSSLIYQMLLASGKDAYLCGNIGAPALDFLEKMTPNSFVVYELSSFQLMEMNKSPRVAVVLMITNDHLDFHSTNQEYVASKANIVRFQKEDDMAVINKDYPSSLGTAELTPAQKYYISRKEKVANGAYIESGSLMLAKDGAARKIIEVSEVPLAGEHNLENVGAAIMVADLLGVSDAAMVQAIKSFKALPHRLELVHEAGGVKYYDDSISTTPESAIAALRSFKAPKILILGGSDKGADWHELASVLSSDASLKAVIGIGEEWPKIKDAISKADGMNFKAQIIENIKTMSDAVRAAQSVAQSGDVVVLSPACASFDMFKNYQDRGEQFAAAVRALS
jgi:UDP-N-acetylmuramoylalanine--D-glutamate ligase